MSGTIVVGYDGSPAAEAIVRVAAAGKADEIIVGSRGFGRARALLGSVAHEVLHGAGCPITVITERVADREASRRPHATATP
jgi:nucleotide-binding universal stress UspA family protein